MCLFVNWLIRGDSSLWSSGWLNIVWRLMSVSVIINKLRVTGAGNRTVRVTGNGTSPAYLVWLPSRQETGKQIGQIRIVPLAQLALTLWHLLNTRSYLYCQEWEHFSTNWEWPQHKQGENVWPRARHNPRHAVSRSHDGGMRDSLLMTSVQWGQVTRSVFAIFLVIRCHALNYRAPGGRWHRFQPIRGDLSKPLTNERPNTLSCPRGLTWHLAHFCANYRPLLGWCLGTLDWPSWPRDQEGEETRHFERSGLWRI